MKRYENIFTFYDAYHNMQSGIMHDGEWCPLTVPTAEIPENNDNGRNPIENMKLRLIVGEKVLTATLIDNPTTRDFIS